MLPGPLRAGSGRLWKETAPRTPTSAHVHPRRLPDKGLSCLLLVEDPLRMPLPDTPPHSHACWGAGEAWLVPLSTLLGTDTLSGQLTRRATPFLLAPSCPGEAAWLPLGTQPLPSSTDKAVGTDEGAQGTGTSPFSAASQHPCCHSHATSLGLSFPPF